MSTWTDRAGVEHPLSDQDRWDAIRLYIALFAPRTSAYSVWTDAGHRPACAKGCARCSWIARHRDEEAPADLPSHDRAPLTPDVVLRAFATKRPVSAYMLAEDSTTHVMALDVDREKDGLLVCDRVARAMKRTGIAGYVEESRRGGHLWVTLERAVPGIVARRALLALLEAADVPTDDPKIELRPGQDRLNGPDGLGNALRMPLMPHQATGQRPDGLMVPGGRLVATTIPELVNAVEPAPVAIVEEWSERWQPDEPVLPIRAPEDRPRTIERFNAEVGVCQVLMVDWGVDRAVPGKAIRCPAHDDKNPSLSVMRDDRRAYCHSPGCLFHNEGRGRDAYDLAQLAGTVQRGAA